MFSLLRDFGRFFRDARYDLLLVWLALAGFAAGGGCTTARGEDAEATARAALALAKAKRDREAVGCFADYEAAAAEARRLKKPLVLWVGMTCADHPGLRRELGDAVHCHLPRRGRDPAPSLVIPGADGVEWFVRSEKIGPDTARKVRAKWAAPPEPPLRPDVGVGEEL